MSDYYYHFLASMSGTTMGTTMGTAMVPIISPGGELMPHQLQGTPPPMVVTSTPGGPPTPQLGYFPGATQEPGMFNPSKPQKGRRKTGIATGSGVDHVKHRRTRSGCFMCRSRRVKCDETRPVCERCKKGNRECIYPDASNAKGSSGNSSKGKEAGAAGSQQTSSPSTLGDEDESDEIDADTKLDTIPDDGEPDEGNLSSSRPSLVSLKSFQAPSRRQTSEAPSQGTNISLSPSTADAPAGSAFADPFNLSETPSILGPPDWSHLPVEIQRCLAFYVDNITHYHYCCPLDSDDFFKTILPSVAIRSEPLLNALVGFSSYHMTLRNPNGKLQDFLQYYNKSVTLLLGCLKRKDKNMVAILLTILQLATIEEYLGDWVNLMGHQKAALEIITSIFTPASIMETPMGRMCLGWYARFDNFIALMGGFPTDLPREWLVSMLDYTANQQASNVGQLSWKIEEWAARLRLISYDMSILFARGSRGQISPNEFVRAHDEITKRLEEWKFNRDPALADSRYLVTDFPSLHKPDPDDIVDPYSPGILYDVPLFAVTILCAEWNSIMIMHKSQSTSTKPDVLLAELGRHAHRTAQYFETLEFWPNTPDGVLILTQACIAIAALFLSHDQRHQWWFRRKFALLETKGYIHPISLRTKMAGLFRDPACVRWWLPNGEGFSPVLESIRNFADERNAAAVTAQQEELREVKHIFAKLSLLDTENEAL